jgi:hypothetical protein
MECQLARAVFHNRRIRCRGQHHAAQGFIEQVALVRGDEQVA